MAHLEISLVPWMRPAGPRIVEDAPPEMRRKVIDALEPLFAQLANPSPATLDSMRQRYAVMRNSAGLGPLVLSAISNGDRIKLAALLDADWTNTYHLIDLAQTFAWSYPIWKPLVARINEILSEYNCSWDVNSANGHLQRLLPNGTRVAAGGPYLADMAEWRATMAYELYGAIEVDYDAVPTRPENVCAMIAKHVAAGLASFTSPDATTPLDEIVQAARAAGTLDEASRAILGELSRICTRSSAHIRPTAAELDFVVAHGFAAIDAFGTGQRALFTLRLAETGSRPSEYTNVRSLVAADWRSLRALRLHGLQADPGVFFTPFSREAERPDSYWVELASYSRNHQLFGVYDSGGLAGVSGAFTSRNDPTGKTLTFGMTYLLPAYRGQGFAQQLFQKRLEWAKRFEQFERIEISHRRSNEPSRRLILKNGFAYTDSVQYTWPDGEIEDELRYSLSLRET